MPGPRSSRPATWIRCRTVLLVLVLVLPGTPEVVTRLYAEKLAHERLTAHAAPGRNTLPAQRTSNQAAPPSPSGAYPPYPLNHSFDAEIVRLPGSPTNYDFEAADYQIGSPPTNYDFEMPPVDTGGPSNGDFASGNFTDWTILSGTPTIETTGGPDGNYSRMGSGVAVETLPFVLSSDAQELLFDYGLFASRTGTASIYIDIAAGPSYTWPSTHTLSYSCSGCSANWGTGAVGVTEYQGQSVKLRFSRNTGTVGFDRVRTRQTFPGWSPTGKFGSGKDGTNTYARIFDGTLTSSAFTVDAATQFALMSIRKDNSALSEYRMYVLSGAGYATSTEVAQSGGGSSWADHRINLQSFQGQSIKLKIEDAYGGQFRVGSLGFQVVDVPNWRVPNGVTRVSDGQGGTAVRFGGNLTSEAFTIPEEAQQLTFRYRASDQSGTSIWVELLRGPTFSTVTGIALVSGSPGVWNTYRQVVTAYAGETLKIRFRPQLQDVYVDDAVIIQDAVPGWTLSSSYGAAVPGQDSNGTYLTGFGGSINLTSSLMDPGVLDQTVSHFDSRSFVLRAAHGGTSNTGFINVYWIGANGSSSNVFSNTSSSATPVTNFRFRLDEGLPTPGRFRIFMTGSARVYSIADNIARQQLSEPFSQQAGSGIDTSTGSFGTSETDLTIQSGPLPLVFTRYYHGHSDRFAELGFRWSHSFNTYLGIYGSDVSVVFGSGKEEFFRSTGSGTFAAADVRVKSTLTKYTSPPDGVDYRYRTKDNLTYNFEGDGDLISIVDANGNAITLYRDPVTELITAIEDPGGRTLDLTYDVNGRLATVTGPDGAVVTYTYDSEGDLVAVDKPEDARTEYVYSKHRLTQIKQRQGEDLLTAQMVAVLTNTLDEFNRVIAQADATTATVEFGYLTGADQGVTRVTDPLGEDTDYYFDEYARTTHVVAPTGDVTEFSYDSNGNLADWYDPNGGKYEYDYNSDADPTSVTDPLGNPTSITWNSSVHRPTETVVDPGSSPHLNLRTTFVYDTLGNLLQRIVDPGGLDLMTRWVYDDAGNVLEEIVDPAEDFQGLARSGNHLSLMTRYVYSNNLYTMKIVDPATDSQGVTRPGVHLDLTWEYEYDSKGRLTKERDPEGHTTVLTYNRQDQVKKVIVDPNDSFNPRSAPFLQLTTEYFYDLAGHIVAMKDPYCAAPGRTCESNWYYAGDFVTAKYDNLGVRTAYKYDANGRVIAEVADARPPGATGQFLETRRRWTYDASGRVTSVIVDPAFDESGTPFAGQHLDLMTRYEYEPVSGGLVFREILDPSIDAEGNTRAGTHLNLTTVSVYDHTGKLTGKQLPGSTGAWEYAYDAAGRLTQVTDPLNQITTYTYDKASRLTTVRVDPNGLNLTTQYEYDAAGRQTEVIEPSGKVIQSAYDAASRRVTSTIDPGSAPHLNITTQFDYFKDGKLANVTDPDGLATWYEYDDANRQVEVTAPDGQVVTTIYDEANRAIAVQMPNGTINETTYNARGDTINVVQDAGVGRLNLETNYTVDNLGRVTATANPRGKTTSTTYDAAGRTLTITDAMPFPDTGTVSFDYDNASRVTGVTNARGYEWSLDYNDAGQVTSIVDPVALSAGVTTFEYDDLGRKTRSVDPNGTDLRYLYDSANRLVSTTNAAGTYTYLSNNYGTDGLLASVTNDVPNGAVSYEYDAADRVVQVTDNMGETNYEFSPGGRKLSMELVPQIGGLAREVGYTYSSSTGKLESMTDWQNQTTTFTYTSLGLVDVLERPNNVTTDYDYDALGRLDRLAHTQSSTSSLIAQYDYVLDENGNRTNLTMTGAAYGATPLDESYVYDDLDRLISATYADGGTVSYGYDKNGNRASVTSGGVTTTYVYDEADRLLRLESPPGTPSYFYGWSSNGNRETAGPTGNVSQNQYDYDWDNRLESANIDGTTTSFEYAADGTRLTKVTGSTSTSYLYDRKSGLPKVIDDGTTSYVWGPGSLFRQIDNGNGDNLEALTDALGSIRVVTDTSGAVAGLADWDVWGNLRASSGSQAGFGWAGEQQDLETGLVYLRARYYAPGPGQFITRDTLQPNAGGTQGWTAYSYAQNNPMTLTDPSGHVAIGDLVGIGGGIAAIFRYILCFLSGDCTHRQKWGSAEDKKIDGMITERPDLPTDETVWYDRLVPTPIVLPGGIDRSNFGSSITVRQDTGATSQARFCAFGSYCDTFKPPRTFVPPQFLGGGWACLGESGPAVRNWGYFDPPERSFKYLNQCEVTKRALNDTGLAKALVVGEWLDAVADGSGDFLQSQQEATGEPFFGYLWMGTKALGLTANTISFLVDRELQDMVEQNCTPFGVVYLSVSTSSASQFEDDMNEMGVDSFYGGFTDPKLYTEGTHYRPQNGQPGGYTC